jgi:hypothetical protein
VANPENCINGRSNQEKQMTSTAPLRLIIVALIATSGLAEDGKLLSRTELPISNDLLQSAPGLARLSEAVQKVRFSKMTYESDGLKINGYIIAPKEAKASPCIIMARGGNRNFAPGLTPTLSVYPPSPLVAISSSPATIACWRQ